MNITKQFLSFSTVSVGIITATDYQPLFCHAFMDVLQKNAGLEKTTLLIDDGQWASFESTLKTTFLGQKKLYWLGSTQDYDAVAKKKLAALLSQYQGPHQVCLFVPEKDRSLFSSDTAVVVALDQLTDAEKISLRSYTYGVQTVALTKTKSTTKLTLTLDQEHIMHGYATVCGKNSQQFMNSWYDKIIQPEESLFTLAQAFFARVPEQFFPLWNRVKNDYAGVFWVAFWSDQIWRAHYVIKLRHEQKLSQAQQLSFRLPFSFLQKDWRSFDIKELQHAHQALYDIDYALKNGASEECINVFCTAFVLKQL